MKIISTRVHGVIDYLLGFILLYSPLIFNFPGEGIHRSLPVILGALSIIYSLATNYESGMEKVLPMKTHLKLDVALGILLAASPWVFGFYQVIYLPHLVLGSLGLVIATISDPVPGHKHRTASKQHAH